jgi:hypothetical protein
VFNRACKEDRAFSRDLLKRTSAGRDGAVADKRFRSRMSSAQASPVAA